MHNVRTAASHSACPIVCKSILNNLNLQEQVQMRELVPPHTSNSNESYPRIKYDALFTTQKEEHLIILHEIMNWWNNNSVSRNFVYSLFPFSFLLTLRIQNNTSSESTRIHKALKLSRNDNWCQIHPGCERTPCFIMFIMFYYIFLDTKLLDWSWRPYKKSSFMRVIC